MNADVPAVTTLDAAAQGVAGIVYMAVGIAAWLSRPRDIRTRVFLGLAIVNTIAFAVPVLQWYTGTRSLDDMSRGSYAALLTSLAVGSVLLFHFCQVFPWRRPLIARWGWLLPPLYVVPAVASLAFVVFAPDTLKEVTNVYLAALVAVGLPLVVVVAIVLPIGGILSLVRSYREAAGEARRPMRIPLAWLLVSQIAAGSIGLIFAPVLGVLAPGSTAEAVLKIALSALGIMTPIAFALANWTYRLPD